ncbi:sugar phosphate isomerase/epimerase [Paenibacillus sp. CF384]|uniref:sugar phosphate isomerase/epimerase family protein n=1 Tax=Paenibacillus sp. CF384 TaxID=1884382 RepID=UPI00089D31CB|nr:sugar phosphate isomerase/epimerase [Paenibacillus sp. CF384]SDX13780.1 2-keto-myo-inositol dehydratase [Paenibacillus sp. CF384]
MIKNKGFSTGLYGYMCEYWKDGKDPSMEEIFRSCAEAGMNALELDPTPELVTLAKQFGLAISGAYIGLQLHEPFETLNIEETVIPVAKRVVEAGGTDLVINADPKGGWDAPQAKTEEEFKQIGDNLSRIAAAVSGLGLKVSLHNHASDKHNADGDLRAVIEYASQEVGLCVDTGWAHVAGLNPVELLRTYSDRIYAFHFRNQIGRIYSEDLTVGDIDMKQVLQAASDIGYEGWLTFELVHEEGTGAKGTLAEATATSIAYMKSCIAELA